MVWRPYWIYPKTFKHLLQNGWSDQGETSHTYCTRLGNMFVNPHLLWRGISKTLSSTDASSSWFSKCGFFSSDSGSYSSSASPKASSELSSLSSAAASGGTGTGESKSWGTGFRADLQSGIQFLTCFSLRNQQFLSYKSSCQSDDSLAHAILAQQKAFPSFCHSTTA